MIFNMYWIMFLFIVKLLFILPNYRFVWLFILLMNYSFHCHILHFLLKTMLLQILIWLVVLLCDIDLLQMSSLRAYPLLVELMEQVLPRWERKLIWFWRSFILFGRLFHMQLLVLVPENSSVLCSEESTVFFNAWLWHQPNLKWLLLLSLLLWISLLWHLSLMINSKLWPPCFFRDHRLFLYNQLLFHSVSLYLWCLMLMRITPLSHVVGLSSYIFGWISRWLI